MRKFLILFFAIYLIAVNACCAKVKKPTPHRHKALMTKNAKKTTVQPAKKQAKKQCKKAVRRQIGPISQYTFKMRLGKKPAVINVMTIDMNNPKVALKVAYGSNKVKNLSTVKDLVKKENAVAGINGSFFKPGSGSPIGLSIIDGQLKTGPFTHRSVFGLDKNNEGSIDKVEIKGKIAIGNDLEYELNNINQYTLSSKKPSVFTSDWGKISPKISNYFVNVNVVDYKIVKISANPILLDKNNLVIVLPKKLLNEKIAVGKDVKFEYKLFPEKWNSMMCAVCGGPNLVKGGKIFIDRQKFSHKFLWAKAPRTAIGYTRSKKIILLTIDGREKGRSEGATVTELARIMRNLGCVEAMNLDGGSSTQMILGKKLVNNPSVKGGARVSNAIVVKI